MKKGITVVYVRDAEQFKLSGLLSPDFRYVGDSEVQRLRNHYKKVREQFPDLPKEVGVATYHFMTKRHAKEIRDEIDTYIVLEGKISGYPELDVLEGIIALSKLNVEDPLERNMAYRNIMLLACCPLLVCDQGLGESVVLAPAFPEITMARDKLKEMYECLKRTQLTDLVLQQSILTSVEGTIEKCSELLGMGGQYRNSLEIAHQKLKERFDKNKVSRNFPLQVAPYGFSSHELFHVSLEDGIEKPGHYDGVMKYLLAGLKASGQTEIPESILKEINRYDKERFGITTRIYTLDYLLKRLPEEKVIFTDIPIVDAIPQMADLPFETIECDLQYAITK